MKTKLYGTLDSAYQYNFSGWFSRGLSRQTINASKIFGCLIALQNDVVFINVFNSNLLSFYERALDVW